MTIAFEPLATFPSVGGDTAALWDPKNGVTWLFNGNALFRGKPGARITEFERVAVGVNLGWWAPTLFIDSATGDLHAWGTDHAGAGAMFRFDGAHFVTNGIAPLPTSEGALTFDPQRGVVVLVERKTGRIHERAANGTWSQPASLNLTETDRAVAAVWDEPRGAVVIASFTAYNPVGVWQWNGALEAIASLPTNLSSGVAPALGFINPKTKRATFFASGVELIEVAATSVIAIETPVSVAGRRGVSVDPTGAQFWGTWLREQPAEILHLTWSGDAETRADDNWFDALLSAGLTAWKAERAPEAHWGKARDASADLYEMNGSVERSREGTTREVLGTHPDFSRWGTTQVGDVEDGDRLLVVAGQKPPYNKFNASRETWQWLKETGFTELKTKGKPVGRIDGLGARIPGRGWVIVGGKQAKPYSEVPVLITEELEGNVWSAFDTSTEGQSPAPVFRRLFSDRTSGRVFGLVTDETGATLYPYVGKGVWQKGPTVGFAGDFADNHFGQMLVEYDVRERRLVAKGRPGGPRGEAGIFAVPLGAWLDGLAPVVVASAPSRAAKPKQAVQERKVDAAEQAGPVARYLWYREDGVGKFWFGELKTKSWTASWGKRGATPQQKTYDFSTHEKTRADFEKKVQEKLDKGYTDAPQGAAAANLAQKLAYLVRPGKSTSAANDSLRGTPSVDAPVCASCHQPMSRIALLSAHAERLPLGDHAGLAVYQCENDSTSCQTWAADGGANAVLVLNLEAFVAQTKAAGATALSFRPKVEVDWAVEGQTQPDPGGSKVNGYPTWVHDPEVPTCEACAAPMAFAAQFDASDVGANFGDSGVGYAFVCALHGKGKFVWQG